MRRLLPILLALLLIAPLVHAHPKCWHNLDETYTDFADKGSGWEFVAAWTCDPDMTPVVEFFNGIEIAKYAIPYYTKKLSLFDLDRDYDSAPRPRNAIAKAQERRILVDVFGAIPKVVENKAYKKSVDTTGEKFVLVGTIPIGTPCEPSGNAGDMMRVDRSLVQYPSPNSVKPPIAWAKCG